MRRRGKETGGLVFIQVKCGGDGYRNDQKQYPDKIGISLGKKYVADHRPRWNSTLGPSVIVFVDDTVDARNPPAWWADLRDPETYSPTNAGMLLIPLAQRFGPHTKGDFHKLCGSGPVDRNLPVLSMKRDDLVIPGRTETLLRAARIFYKNWAQNEHPVQNKTLGTVLINRVGWRHITRQARLKERVFQSLALLGVARRMVAELPDIDMLGRPTVSTSPEGELKVIDHLGIRANVTFPHRHQSVVQVVLRRERIISKNANSLPFQRIWFLSIYELRRGL